MPRLKYTVSAETDADDSTIYPPTCNYTYFITMVTLKIRALTSWLQCTYVERNLLELESVYATATLSIFPDFTSKNERYVMCCHYFVRNVAPRTDGQML